MEPHPPPRPRQTTASSRTSRDGTGGAVHRRFRESGSPKRPVKMRVTNLMEFSSQPEAGDAAVDPSWDAAQSGSSPERVRKTRPVAERLDVRGNCMLCAASSGIGPVETDSQMMKALKIYGDSCPTCHPSKVASDRRGAASALRVMYVCAKAANCAGRKTVSSVASNSPCVALLCHAPHRPIRKRAGGCCRGCALTPHPRRRLLCLRLCNFTVLGLRCQAGLQARVRCVARRGLSDDPYQQCSFKGR